MRFTADGLFGSEDGRKSADAVSCGQFVSIRVGRGENILPRPISVCEYDADTKIIRVVYAVVGSGTAHFTSLKPGDTISAIGANGNGFRVVNEKPGAVVVGGGVGIPPLLQLVKELVKIKKPENVHVFLGFRDETFLVEEFAAVGVNVSVATDSGASGFKGTAVAALMKAASSATAATANIDMIYSCGPRPMLRALSQFADAQGLPCQVSMEERMACSVGACLGCVTKLKGHGDNAFVYKKVCADGPVFNGSDIVWDE